MNGNFTMKMHTKIILLLVVITLTTACSWRKPPAQQGATNIALDDVQTDMTRKRQNVKMLNEPGMIHIQRHTKEYSISMILDASDENIYFVMDLPQEEMEDIEEKPEENVEPEEEPIEENVAEEQAPEEPVEEVVEEKPEPKPPLDETQASKYVLYAQTYFLEKKYARALEEVNRALEYSPNSAVAHSLKGSIYFKLDERDLAKGSWEKALELDESLDNVKRMLDKLNNS
jgi:tetratricopeptide (TPR) repeat protein